MDKEDKFCLKWNAYSSNLEKCFRELRQDKLLFDVTLACENQQVEAHRVVLSACSNFFKEVLRSNPHSHPLLYLRGVSVVQLSALLDFMYDGEVNIGQTGLSDFLSVAGDLGVKGLTPDDAEAGERLLPTCQEKNEVSPETKRRKLSANPVTVREDLLPDLSAVNVERSGGRGIVKHEDFEEHGDFVEDGEMVFTEAGFHEEELGNMAASEDLQFGNSTSSGVYDEHNAKVDLIVRSKMMETSEGWACSDCDFTGTIRKVYQHVEMSHVTVTYYCQICQKVCKTRNSLFCHRYRYHRNKTDEMPAKTANLSSSVVTPPNKSIGSHAKNFLHKQSQDYTPSNYILAKIENQ